MIVSQFAIEINLSHIHFCQDKQEKSAIRDPNVLSASQKKRMKKKARKEREAAKKEQPKEAC